MVALPFCLNKWVSGTGETTNEFTFDWHSYWNSKHSFSFNTPGFKKTGTCLNMLLAADTE